jgi:hypothetical protein
MPPLALLVAESTAITLIFVRGSIFDWLRAAGPAWWRELASCALCSGFWIGGAWYAISRVIALGYANFDVARCFGAAALCSAAALLVVRVLDALESAAPPVEPDDE